MSVPFLAVDQVPVAPLAGKVVIDTNNYYFERDGHVAEIDDGPHDPQRGPPGAPAGVARREALQRDPVRPPRHPGRARRHRRVAARCPIAGDDAAAKATVAALTDEIGYDVVDVGPLAEGWRFDRDQPAYGPEVDAAGLTDLLGQAKRASA